MIMKKLVYIILSMFLLMASTEVFAVKKSDVSVEVAAKSSTSLGAARSSVRGYLKNVGNVPRNQLVKDLEGAGFKKVFDGNGMQHFQRGKWKIRLDPPHLNGKNPTPFNHMHINRGGNKNTFDIFLNPVSPSSPGAHIPIR